MTYTYVVVSINGGEYPQKQPFQTLAKLKAAVPKALTDQTSYWRVWVLDADGKRVLMGTRSGYNATGRSWVWADAERAAEHYNPGEPTYQEADTGVVTPAELHDITRRHTHWPSGIYEPWEIRMGRWEI